MLMVCYQVYQTENDWIPCSERLPEKSDYYHVTVRTITGDRQIKELFYQLDLGWSKIDGIEVIAWMPLPEPFKGDL